MKYKSEKDFMVKQLKDLIAKTQGAINLIDNSPTHFARNKMLGLCQKLGYMLQRVSNWTDETGENESNQDSDISE